MRVMGYGGYKTTTTTTVTMEDFEDDNIIQMDHHVDVLQTYNTALCYLCSINADVSELEQYLTQYPQSLLLENMCLMNDDSATFILQQHSKLCHCQSLECHLNRIQVMDLMERGYIYFRHQFQQRNTKDTTTPTNMTATTIPIPAIDTLSTLLLHLDQSNIHFVTLVQLEHNIRQWRIQELTIRNTMMKLSIALRTHHIELKRCRSQQQQQQQQQGSNSTKPVSRKQLPSQHPSTFSLLACTIGRHHNNRNQSNTDTRDVTPNVVLDDDDDDDDPKRPYSTTGATGSHPNRTTTVPNDRRSVLQHHIRTTNQQLQQSQDQHDQLIQNIRNGRREQFNIFKNYIFQNCVRHNICSMMIPNRTTTMPSPPTSTSTMKTTTTTTRMTDVVPTPSNAHHNQRAYPPHKHPHRNDPSSYKEASKMLPPVQETQLSPSGEVNVDTESLDNATAYSI